MKKLLAKIGIRYFKLAMSFVFGTAMVNLFLLNPICIIEFLGWIMMLAELRLFERSMKSTETKAETETAE